MYLSSVGMKRDEHSNQRGNVMTVISDKIAPIDTTSDGLWDYFNPSLVSATDYYPFGMEMPGRGFSNYSYGLGAWGSETESFAKGWYYFKDRMYDSRVSRWSTIDRFFRKYPFQSPFAAFDNSPQTIIDPGGDTTIYFSQSSKYLHSSNDALPTAIVVIDSKNLMRFTLSLRASIQKGVQNYGPTNERWRTLGYRIDVDKWRNFYNRETIDGKNNLSNVASNGKLKDGYFNESRTYCYFSSGGIEPGDMSAAGGLDFVATYPPIENGKGIVIGDGHTHPNEGLPANVFGQIFDYNPSPNDLSNKGTFDIIIGRENIYLYGKSINGVIRLNKSTLKSLEKDEN